jgi:hypothetical protein
MVTKGGDGYIGSLSPEQAKIFKEFKMAVFSENTSNWKYDLSQFDDYDYARFLRARKYDLKKSLEMFEKYIKWRIGFGVDKIFVLCYANFTIGIQIP